MQSNIIGSTTRKTHGGSDLSESACLVQVHALRFVKLARKFIVEAENVDHAGINEAKADEYLDTFLSNFKVFNDQIDLQLLSMTHGVIADLSDPYVRDLIATQDYFAKPLLAATEEIIRLSESSIFKLVDVLLAKTDAENFEATGLLYEAVEKMENNLGKLVEATVSCVRNIQHLIDYGLSTFVDNLACKAESVRALGYSTKTSEFQLSNVPYLHYGDDSVLKVGYAAMKILSVLHNISYNRKDNDGWFSVNRKQLDICFSSECYSSSRLDNALTILDGLSYVEMRESDLGERLFRLNYKSIAATLITQTTEAVDVADGVENKQPLIVLSVAVNNSTIDRKAGKDRHIRKSGFDWKNCNELPLAA